ncbi:hypothetical protein HS088_TW12G01008 [Tripterygium wilfordii]|uniref:Uncharacterized protein n=1 Tax=Tripterygium wilfordii TaxID=458696 RepID=A0A7J7D0I7_TRIWF|nr:hypothetical protein HS088_TW12G01008 [Tripterygium wilfordii]
MALQWGHRRFHYLSIRNFQIFVHICISLRKTGLINQGSYTTLEIFRLQVGFPFYCCLHCQLVSPTQVIASDYIKIFVVQSGYKINLEVEIMLIVED